VDSVVYWLELVVGDVWIVWYADWNRPNNFNSQDYNHYPFLAYIYILLLLLKALQLRRSFGLPNEFFPFGTVFDAVLPIYLYYIYNFN
jgi:hypothetical protein